MRKLVIALVVLGVVVAALAYADLRVRGLAEEQAEAKLRTALPQLRGVRVRLDGFPFTPRVLLDGTVEGLHVSADGLAQGKPRLERLSLDVDTVKLDKHALVDERRLVVTGIGRARAQVIVSDDAVSELIGQKVRFSPGKVHATVQGQEIALSASVKGRAVHLAATILGVPPVIFPLPPDELMPCTPELELREGELRLSCTVDKLPPQLAALLAKG